MGLFLFSSSFLSLHGHLCCFYFLVLSCIAMNIWILVFVCICFTSSDTHELRWDLLNHPSKSASLPYLLSSKERGAGGGRDRCSKHHFLCSLVTWCFWEMAIQILAHSKIVGHLSSVSVWCSCSTFLGLDFLILLVRLPISGIWRQSVRQCISQPLKVLIHRLTL